MTEMADEKRKRRLIDSFRSHQWKYQYSIFPRLQGLDRDEDFAIANYALLENDSKFRRKLGEQFSETAFLFEFRRLVLPKKFKPSAKYRKDFTQVYITFHTLKKLNEEKLLYLINLIYPENASFISRLITNEDIEKAVETIKCQNLHSQIIREDGRRVNRFSLINVKHIALCKKT